MNFLSVAQTFPLLRIFSMFIRQIKYDQISFIAVMQNNKKEYNLSACSQCVFDRCHIIILVTYAVCAIEHNLTSVDSA